MPAPVIPPPTTRTSSGSAAIAARSDRRVSNEKDRSIRLFGAGTPARPSGWFARHEHLFRAGVQALDIACGEGRHAIAAATLGAAVVAIDSEAAKLNVGRRQAEKRKLPITWTQADLTTHTLRPKAFDVVMMFLYLDRARMPDFLEAVKPGGWFIGETFLRTQTQYGWGPTSPDHLLAHGEFPNLVAPFEIGLAREGTEIANGRPMDVAGILAQRPIS